MSTSSWIVDTTAATFQRDVLEGSMERPVLVDFWATWCGPCKTLTPILEKLAREGNGRFTLAKVDTDANPELAQAFRIQSVPTVVLFDRGRPVDGFAGALPEAELRRFLDELAPPRGEDELARADRLAEEGDRAAAIQLLRETLRAKPDRSELRLALVRHLIENRQVTDAKKVWDKLDEDARESAEGRSIATRLELAERAGEVDLDELRRAAEADPSDLAAKLALGRGLVALRQYGEGLEVLMEVASEDVHFEGDAPRKAMLEVFEALGPDHPLTVEYRYRLQLLLFV